MSALQHLQTAIMQALDLANHANQDGFTTVQRGYLSTEFSMLKENLFSAMEQANKPLNLYHVQFVSISTLEQTAVAIDKLTLLSGYLLSYHLSPKSC
ncbi:MAG: hypothetical protein KBE16_04725 [Alphaproteobacteria bacterium]|nr:hypothetical protein [Alphaproteobacteria bacterium]MBP9877192.1 hypothetical protein [Alphaproteobacteria bacterium]